MLSPMDSVELFEIELKPKISISETLEILKEDELRKLIKVVAEDFRFKFEQKSKLRFEYFRVLDNFNISGEKKFI